MLAKKPFKKGIGRSPVPFYKAALAPSLPTGAVAIWDAADYVATPRRTIKNSAVNGATDANLLAAPRRMFNRNESTYFFWGPIGGSTTMTDLAAVAPDGSNDASTLLGASSSAWGYAYGTVSLPPGDYTACLSARSLSGAADAMRLAVAGDENFTSLDLVVGTSWTRLTFTFTKTGTGNIDFRFLAPAAGSQPNLAICDYQVFAGASDLNTTWNTLPPLAIRNADAVIGNSHFAPNAALVAGMVPASVLSHAQFAAARSPSDFTVLYCTKPNSPDAGLDITGIMSWTGSEWYRFVMGYNASGGAGGETMYYNGQNLGVNANGRKTSGSSWGRNGQGVMTGVDRRNGSQTSKFVNGLKLQDGPPDYIPSAPALRDVTLGGVRTINVDLLSGHDWGIIVYYERALSDAEVAQAMAYFKFKYGDVGLKRVLGLDGTSITQILPTYQSYVGPNLSPQRLITSQAVSSADIAAANATHVPALDAIITAGPPQDSYVLSVELITNDLFYGRTPAQVISDTKAYILARRAVGWQKFILWTCLPRSPQFGATAEAQFNADRASVNATLRADVGTWFDALVDQAADSTIGPDGAWSDATYYPDGTHPSPFAHQTIIEPLFRAVVNSL